MQQLSSFPQKIVKSLMLVGFLFKKQQQTNKINKNLIKISSPPQNAHHLMTIKQKSIAMTMVFTGLLG